MLRAPRHMPLALNYRAKLAIYLGISFLGVALGALAGIPLAHVVPPGAIILYLPSVLFATWYAGRAAGLATIGASMLAWFWVGIDEIGDLEVGGLIDASAHFALFAVVVLSISAYRTYYLREKERAISDPLTGTLDRRGFHEYAEKEVVRARRYKHPVSLVYIDVDNFKEINEWFGHAGGDTVLRTIATALQHSTRKIDAVARLGGDEFGILFPETDAEAAKAAVNGLHSRIRENLKRFDRPVTVSIGAVTFARPDSVEAMLQGADKAMYQVKHGGKDDAIHFTRC